MRLLSTEQPIRDTVIHEINTIMRIPQMYAGSSDPKFRDKKKVIQTALIKIFSDVAVDSNYSGGLIKQQVEIDQLINTTVSDIKHDLLPMTLMSSNEEIKANNTGWGPIQVGQTKPTDLDRILPAERFEEVINLKSKLDQEKLQIVNREHIQIDQMINSTEQTVNELYKFEEKLVFGDGEEIYGSDLIRKKIFFLLMYRYLMKNHKQIFVERIMNNTNFMNGAQFYEYLMAADGTEGDGVNISNHSSEGYIYMPHISEILNYLRDNNHHDILNMLFQDGANNGIFDPWAGFFVNWLDITRNHEISSSYTNTSLKKLIKNPAFSAFSADYKELVDAGIDKNITWLGLFNRTFNKLRAGIPFNDITAIEFAIPSKRTPVNITLNFNQLGYLIAGNQKFLYIDVFRIFDLLIMAINNGGNFDRDHFPDVFDMTNNVYINTWVNDVDKKYTVMQRGIYLDLILCEKIFYTIAQLEIKQVLEGFYDLIFLSEIPNYNLLPAGISIRDTILDRFKLFNQNHMYALILPSRVEKTDAKLKYLENILFLADNSFDIFFNQLIAADPGLASTIIDFVSDFFNNTRTTDAFTAIPLIRNRIINLNIATDPTFETITNTVLHQNSYKSFANKILSNTKDTYKKFVLDPAIEIEHGIKWNPIMRNRDSVATNYISKINKFDNVIELISYYFTRAIRSFLTFDNNTQNINIIISDITAHIKDTQSVNNPKRHEYYIPQIFLPALIKQSMQIIESFRNILLYVDEYIDIYTQFASKINITDKNQNNVIILFNDFNAKIKTIIEDEYKKAGDIFTYHNFVIDYLNKVSTSKLIDAINEKLPPHNTLIKFFDAPLSRIDDLPEKINDIETFHKIITNYKIPIINYFAGNPLWDVDETIYDYENDKPIAPVNKIATMYRTNIMDLKRVGTNAGISLNSQCNLFQTIATNKYYINSAGRAVPGEWFNFVTPATEIKLQDAFIRWVGTAYTIESLPGAPDIIFPLIDTHLQLQKQRIIELVVQHIVTTKDSTSKEIYDEIKTLANDQTFDRVPDTKIYVVVAQLVDNIVINMVDYAIKQSVHNWIYDEIQSFADYKGLTDGSVINIIQKKDYMKLSPGDLETKLVTDMLSSYNKYVQFQIPPVEPNPSDPAYFATYRKESATPEKTDKLISYLYNINYFSPTADNTTNMSQCFIINPTLVSKLITPGNLNKQNSDRQTPLHYAVQMINPDTVDLLISRGAKQFKNSNQKTPKDLALDGLKENINLIPASKVSDFVGGFANPFNNLLIARLSEDKWKNNIIRGIKFGIPIQLCIIQHMYHTAVQNYRLGISSDLKSKLMDLFKRNNIGPIYTYPIDLFEVTKADMARLLSYADFNHAAKTSVLGINQKKINSNQKQLDFVLGQINGLQKESDSMTDPDKIAVINSAIQVLTIRKNDFENKITGLKFVPESNPVVDDGFIGAYEGSLAKLKLKVENRTWTISKFYDEAFGSIGRTKALHLAIWQNYMNKRIPNAPSMIFLSIHTVLRSTLQHTNKALIKTDLQTIEDFLFRVKEYIDQRVDLPKDLDNPILAEESEQIIYLIRLFLTEPTIRMVFQQVDKALREMDGSGTLYTDTESVMNKIYFTKYNGETIESYVHDTLPSLSCKFFSQTYGQNDPSKKITLLTEIFNPIVSILQANTVVVFDSESILIRNLNEYLLPFLSETYQNFIHHLRLSTYGFERYIINLYQMVRIYRTML